MRASPRGGRPARRADPRCTVVATTRPTQSIPRKDPIRRVEQATKEGPTRRRHQPTEPDGTIRSAKHLHVADNGPIGKNTVNPRHQLVVVEAIPTGVEARQRDVFAVEPSTPSVYALQELDLASTQRAVAIKQDSNLPTSHVVQASLPIRWLKSQQETAMGSITIAVSLSLRPFNQVARWRWVSPR